jgi:hypothetical protein
LDGVAILADEEGPLFVDASPMAQAAAGGRKRSADAEDRARIVVGPPRAALVHRMKSNEQLAYEELRWFDKYVKNAEPRKRE